MRLRRVFVVAALLAAVTLPVAASARRLGGARTELAAARLSLERVAGTSQRIAELGARQQRIADRKRPEQDVIARVNAVLTEAGIPLGRFGGLRPESDAALVVGSRASPGIGQGAVAYRRQSVRITLNRLAIPELGAFVSEWAASRQPWTPTQIELSHVRGTANPGRYNASLVITATYVAEP